MDNSKWLNRTISEVMETDRLGVKSEGLSMELEAVGKPGAGCCHWDEGGLATRPGLMMQKWQAGQVSFCVDGMKCWADQLSWAESKLTEGDEATRQSWSRYRQILLTWLNSWSAVGGWEVEG